MLLNVSKIHFYTLNISMSVQSCVIMVVRINLFSITKPTPFGAKSVGEQLFLSWKYFVTTNFALDQSSRHTIQIIDNRSIYVYIF